LRTSLVTLSISHIFVAVVDPPRRENAQAATIFARARILQTEAADKQGMSAALPAFDYQRLDAFKVARESSAPWRRTRAPTSAWLCHHTGPNTARALLSAYLGIAGSLQPPRCRPAVPLPLWRGEACEAAAALEGVLVLNLAPEAEILTLLALLDRLCAMLTRLAHMGERPSGPAQIGRVRVSGSGSVSEWRPAWAAPVSMSGTRPALRLPARRPRTRSRPRPRHPLAATRGPALRAARN